MPKFNTVAFSETHSDTNSVVSDHLTRVLWVQQSPWKAETTKEGSGVLLALLAPLLCQTGVWDINSMNEMVGSHLELAELLKRI